jgi:hypothetical protein
MAVLMTILALFGAGELLFGVVTFNGAVNIMQQAVGALFLGLGGVQLTIGLGFACAIHLLGKQKAELHRIVARGEAA